MSHRLHPRGAHLRHAMDNRAGGFGAFNPFSDIFPGPVTNTPDTGKKTKTKTSSPAQSTANPVLPVPPSSASPISTSASPSVSAVVSPSIPTTTTTSSSSTTTTTTHSSIPVTTTASGSALHDNLSRVVVSHIVSVTASPSVAPSNSALPSTTNSLVAPVIGGVAGGILGLVGLVFLLTFCIRRRKRGDEDAINFDPGQFRRSAMLIEDPPTHQETVNRGYNPPAPPPMMEQRRQMTFPGPSHYDVGSPGGHSPNSGSQLVFQAPFSPIAGVSSPVDDYDPSGHPWGAPAPVLTRNISAQSAHHAPAQYAQYAQYPNLPGPRNGNLAPPQAPEYVDLERTSVTPFQAEQYVEISKHLNTEVPKGLDTPAVDEFVAEKMGNKDASLPPLPPKDPFTTDEEQEATLPMVQELSFPSPPSPVHTTSSRYRIDSTPPTLPAIVVQPRVSVASTYLSDAGSGTPSTPSFPGGQTVLMKNPSPFADSPMGNRFPVTPSPLASSFMVTTPPAANTSFPAEPAPAQARPNAKNRQSVYTVYDPEDAYGGI